VKDLPIHLVLFAVVGLVISGLSAVFAEPEDGRALKGFPRRYLWFLGGCAVFAAVLLAAEKLLARTY